MTRWLSFLEIKEESVVYRDEITEKKQKHVLDAQSYFNKNLKKELFEAIKQSDYNTVFNYSSSLDNTLDFVLNS